MKLYNKKDFLAPNANFSMSAYHALIGEEKIAHFKISDCTKTINLWNDLNNKDEVNEMIEKLKTLSNGINEFVNFIEDNYVDKL